MAVEEPKFTLVKEDGDLQIRDYPELVVAEVAVGGDRRQASSDGFRLLAGYIFGGNAGRNSIAMTAPVRQAPHQGSKIAMTAPVAVVGGPGKWMVQFSMPSEYTLANLPKPNDERVKLRVLPPMRTAVLKFSGLTGDARVATKTEKLISLLSDHGLRSTGDVSLARYDPPWTPWFMRRNELMVPIAHN